MVDSLVNSVVDGRYVIVAPLGQGGMASVYHARDKRLERDVAIKFIHPYLATQDDFTSRFNREARSAAQLSSPYVVSVHDQGVWTNANGNHAYLVMEYIPGPDIRKELTRLGNFTLGTSLVLIEQVLRALSAAHTKGIIHRDVKPENVMVTMPLPPASAIEHPDIHAKVADFGLARAVTRHSTSVGQLMGTISYMAPELVTEGSASAQSDLYAVGIMLYEFLTGSLPFAAETPIATAYQHINSPMPRVAKEAPWLPESIDSFIGLLTAKSPQDRPEDATEALRELLSIIRGIDEETLIRRIPVIPVSSPKDSTYEDETEATRIDVAQLNTPYDHTPHFPPTHHPSSSPSVTAVLAPSHNNTIPPSSSQNTNIDTLTHLPPKETKEITDAQLNSRKKLRIRRSANALGKHGASPHKKRHFLLIFLIFVLAGLASAWYFLFGPGQRVTIPSVVGYEYERALASLNERGITSERVDAYSDEVPAGVVIATDPEGGTSIHPKNTVGVTVSLGIEQVTVPDLSSMNKAQAEETLRQARLTPVFSSEYSETVEKDHVISQGVPSGTKVDHDTSLNVVISQGRKPIDVPQLTGKSKDEASSLIEKAGLKVSITQEYSDTVAEGTVISQTPTNGTLYLGDTVSVVVSRGPEMVSVPNVVGMQRSQAEQALKNAGFDVKVKKILGGYFDTVRLQDPQGDTKVRKGSTITITVV